MAHGRWFVVLCALAVAHLEALRLDLNGRHAADVDDVCFSMATGAVFAASYAASPPGTTRQQPFALLLVLGGMVAWMLASWLVHWVVYKFKTAGEEKRK